MFQLNGESKLVYKDEMVPSDLVAQVGDAELTEKSISFKRILSNVYV